MIHQTRTASPNNRHSILKKIENRTAHVGIVGLGHVGMPLMIAVANAGFQTTGIDICQQKIKQLKQKQETTNTPRNIQITTDFSALGDLDIVNICVPTPLRTDHTPDMQFIVAATEQIAKYLHTEQLVILESTTYPGTTEECVLPILNTQQHNQLKVGHDFFLAYSPERIDPGNSTYTLINIPKIIGGITQNCTHIAEMFYRQFIEKTHTVSSSRTAEVVKLLENTFRSVNIGFINEMALICDRMDLDVWEIINAAATKPFGFMPFYPGPGTGGHCIPIDPHYLSWKAKTYQYHAKFIELASEINNEMPRYTVEKICRALKRQRKTLNGAKLLILGVAYKKDVSDTRISPALKVIQLILEKKATFVYHDPYVPDLTLNRKNKYFSKNLTHRLIQSADCVVILTDHSAVDYNAIVEHAQAIVDTRNATHAVTIGQEKIIRI